MLGILSGPAGFHNFYVGRYWRGFFNIVLSVAAAIATSLANSISISAQKLRALGSSAADSLPTFYGPMSLALFALLAIFILIDLTTVTTDARGDSLDL